MSRQSSAKIYSFPRVRFTDRYFEEEGVGDGVGEFRAAQMKFEDRMGGGEGTSPLAFPIRVMGGWAADFAYIYSSCLEPASYAFYMAALTCMGSMIAGKIKLSTELRTDPRLYTVLLGTSGEAKKSTAIDKTTEFFKDTFAREFRMCEGVGSAEGLQDVMNFTNWDCRTLLCFDEFQQFVNKCKIDGSTLLQMVSSLFEKNSYENVKSGKRVLIEDGYLSMLSASTVETYEACWAEDMKNIGLENRLFLVPMSGARQFSIPGTIPDEIKDGLKTGLKRIINNAKKTMMYMADDDAMEFYNAWYLGLGGGKAVRRVDTYALRLLPLLAANEQKSIIDMDIMMKATTLASWQLQVRQRYFSIEANNVYAAMEIKIRQVLGAGEHLSQREIMRRTNSHRAGIKIFLGALENLRLIGMIKKDMSGNYYNETE